MKNSLSKKITMTMAALAVGMIFLTTAFSSLALNWNFNRYLQTTQEEQNQRIIETLAELYGEATSWTAVRRSTMYVGSTTGTQIHVFDRDGRIIADSLQGMMRMREPGMRWERAQQQRGHPYEYPLYVQNNLVGTVKITHLGQQGLLTGEAVVFRRTVTQTALLTGLTLLMLAISAGNVLARRLTGRFTGLTAVAEKWGRGRFDTRVAVEGDDELTVLGETMNRMASRLEEQSKLRRKLTGDISHELRTPLTTVQSYLEAFLDGVMEPDEKNLQAILAESHRLDRLVNDLQALTDAEPGGKTLRLIPLELDDFAWRETERLRPLLLQKNICLQTERKSNPVLVLANETLLERILGNLLINACKYTPAGGQITLSVFCDKEYAGVAVTDTGIGIAVEHLPHVFERFYRADPSRSRATGGSGIGLAIVQEMAEAMGGYVTVESKPEKGSTFRLYLRKA